ncbi:MAG: glycine dehydrogenase (aminomethyl-transferring) [Deltaproteobacteria bacterium]|mgnify:CR=1 FL=1|nr:glycine dehydrogenase (aminomethyl-transferring) [Deltaproteobacteria bacterium]
MAAAFVSRHIGPRSHEVQKMLDTVGVETVEQLMTEALPAAIRAPESLSLPPALSEAEALEQLSSYAGANRVLRSWLGGGYHDTYTPSVLLRNILENPGWYTAYTPYQAEISQGRLEALLVFQTLVQDLTGMEISNASMLDEATAAAEAMTMAHRLSKKKNDRFLVADDIHPQSLAVLQTRAEPLGVEVVSLPFGQLVEAAADPSVYAALVQYPGTTGTIRDLRPLAQALHDHKALLCVSTDLLSLTVLTPPGEQGADIVVGNSQRFGVPLGYGGPHAAFLAARSKMKRQIPGRVIGVSKDVEGRPALRMALQTREQHIRRNKATSNICTAQVLLAVMAGMYGAWHGPEGLRAQAERLRDMAEFVAQTAAAHGCAVPNKCLFDTVRIDFADANARAASVAGALGAGFNIRSKGERSVVIALDERTTNAELVACLTGMGLPPQESPSAIQARPLPEGMARSSAYMTDDRFHRFRSETQMLRYLHQLQVKDIALDTSMIPLGSCTMKLNAATEMIPVTWRGFGGLHPFAPRDQAEGYTRLFADLEAWLAEVTGFDAISLQPNAGSQGEYAGLLSIRAWHRARGEAHRKVCLIPTSAHGTNPASAVMAGMKVVPVQCDDQGNIDMADLSAQATKHTDSLSALMVTYPSTHGVFEEEIREICAIVHRHGGQVYMDGANMNAMVGLSRPAELGADVLHLNLHKTFCIPHGGGGPGMGPIGVRAHLAPYLPGHPVIEMGGAVPLGTISGAPWGSPSILPISWAYIAMMGGEGLTKASEVAILNANYLATRLKDHFPVLYTGRSGRVAHECILDLRHFHHVTAEDVAKRLMDFGFHAPTLSWPVAGTLMVEPTESEDLAELDRFIDAMIHIRAEIEAVESGRMAPEAGPLRNAPHTVDVVTAEEWTRAYSRTQAAWPVAWLRGRKYWPSVARIDNAWGDRHLFCSCDGWAAVEGA